MMQNNSFAAAVAASVVGVPVLGVKCYGVHIFYYLQVSCATRVIS